tara:strand:+ start:625 stop:792 length:168 start_codon:yes stop_codon:yes gene_type:complete
MKRKHKIKPNFVIDNINDLNNDKIIVTKQVSGDLASAPLRMVIPGLSSLRVHPVN